MNKKKVLYIVLLVAVLALITVGVVTLNNTFKPTENVESLGNIISQNNNGVVNTEQDNNTQPIEKLVVKEKMFMAQIQDVYLNSRQYEGTQIEYEGFIYNIPESENFVVAREYYCCGYDSYFVGLECLKDKKEYDDNTWVKLVGKIKLETVNGKQTPLVEVISITETKEGERVVMY